MECSDMNYVTTWFENHGSVGNWRGIERETLQGQSSHGVAEERQRIESWPYGWILQPLFV